MWKRSKNGGSRMAMVEGWGRGSEKGGQGADRKVPGVISYLSQTEVMV